MKKLARKLYKGLAQELGRELGPEAYLVGQTLPFGLLPSDEVYYLFQGPGQRWICGQLFCSYRSTIWGGLKLNILKNTFVEINYNATEFKELVDRSRQCSSEGRRKAMDHFPPWLYRVIGRVELYSDDASSKLAPKLKQLLEKGEQNSR